MAGPQLPLAMPHGPEQRFDTFVDPPEGLLPWLRAFATGDPMEGCGYLQGAGGSGKTHLLLASCATAREAGVAVAYLPLARLGSRTLDALRAQTDAVVLAVDDVDAIAGDGPAEQALFDLHNRARQQGARLLYAASRAPAGLGLDLPDLRSRLAQCTRMLLPGLDDAGRMRLLRQRAAARGLAIEPVAIEWLLRRVDRDPATLTALLERLDHASLAAQRRITVPFLREVLRTE